MHFLVSRDRILIHNNNYVARKRMQKKKINNKIIILFINCINKEKIYNFFFSNIEKHR